MKAGVGRRRERKRERGTQLQTTPSVYKERENKQRRRREGRKRERNEKNIFFAFSFFCCHHLSIKSKELIHTSFLLYYIYTALKRKRIWGKYNGGDSFSKVEDEIAPSSALMMTPGSV